MSRRACVYVAAVGMIIGASGALAQQTGPQAKIQPQATQSTPEAQPAKRDVPTQAAPSSSNVGTSNQDRVATKNSDDQSSKPFRLFGYISVLDDSCAQWTCAGMAVLGALISAVAVYLVWKSLKKTKDALALTSQANEYARVANETTERVAKEQSRAYCHVDAAYLAAIPDLHVDRSDRPRSALSRLHPAIGPPGESKHASPEPIPL